MRRQVALAVAAGNVSGPPCRSPERTPLSMNLRSNDASVSASRKGGAYRSPSPPTRIGISWFPRPSGVHPLPSPRPLPLEERLLPFLPEIQPHRAIRLSTERQYGLYGLILSKLGITHSCGSHSPRNSGTRCPIWHLRRNTARYHRRRLPGLRLDPRRPDPRARALRHQKPLRQAKKGHLAPTPAQGLRSASSIGRICNRH